MPDRLAPPSDLPPEIWKEIVAAIVEDLIRSDDGFDAETTAIEAGLSAEHKATFIAWVNMTERRIEFQEATGAVSLGTIRFAEDVLRQDVSDDVDAVKAREALEAILGRRIG